MFAPRLGKFVGVLAMSLLLQGCIIVPISGLGGRSDYGELQLRKGSSRKILVLDIEGVINGGGESAGFFSSESTVVQVTEKLRKAEKDSNIKAVVIRMDSPGGGVTASDIVYREVLRYKEKTNVPVYVSMLDVAASGGYYISMAADQVYASPTTVTGSIGVIATFPQIEGLGDKIGVDMEVIKSGKNKDMGAMWHKMSAEERAIMQSVIDEMYNKFTTIVAANRTDLSMEKVRELADGRIYTGQQAYDNGLVDGIMYLDEVIELAAKENGGGKPRVVMYRKTSAELAETYYVSSNVPTPRAAQDNVTQFNLMNVNAGGLGANSYGPVFQYRWNP